MGNEINIIYDYFYGDETLQFAFIRIPKPLIVKDEFKHISNDAKLLFGLLLDRSTLSQKNQWVDDQNRVYIIYTIEEICSDMNVGKNKAIKTLKELEDACLVTKKRRGLGLPTILYVHNFMKSLENAQKFKNQTSGSVKSGNQEVYESNLKTSEKYTSVSLQQQPQEVEKAKSNYTNDNNNNNNDTESSIYLSGTGQDEIDRYISLINQNLEYQPDLYYDRERQELFDELLNLICDVVCVKTDMLRINNKDYPYVIVKGTFLKLKREHVEYVMDNMDKIKKPVKNMRNYLISALFNAYYSIAHSAQNDFNSDN